MSIEHFVLCVDSVSSGPIVLGVYASRERVEGAARQYAQGNSMAFWIFQVTVNSSPFDDPVGEYFEVPCGLS